MFDLQHLDHVALRVRDPERSKAWYRDVLGMEHRFPGSWGGVPIMMALGPTFVALFPAGESERPEHQPSRRIDHFAFRADRSNFDAARRELEEKRIEYDFQDHEICHSIYFPDPDGHRVEITTYEV